MVAMKRKVYRLTAVCLSVLLVLCVLILTIKVGTFVTKKIEKSNPLLHRYKEMTRVPITFIKTPIFPTHDHRTNNLDLVIFVYTKPNDFEYRTVVRETWGNVKVLEQLNSSLFFPLGQTEDSHVEQQITNETDIHNDIIQGSFVDSYSNLTHKGILMLKWFSQYCKQVKHLVKMDSDVIPNVFNLHTFLKKRKYKSRVTSCLINWKSRVLRANSWCGKWCIPKKDYPKHYYPPYCSGTFYTISGDLVTELYELCKKVPLWWVADVHITGHLLLKLPDIHRVVLTNYIETNTGRVIDRLIESPDSFIYGYIASESQIFKAWNIIYRKYRNKMLSK